MSESNQSWNFDELSPEARQTAEQAALSAGMPLDAWLNQLIKYVSAMELKGEAPAGDNGLDSSIKALAAAQYAAEASTPPSDAGPPVDVQPGEHQPDDLLPEDEAWPGDDVAFGHGPAYGADTPFGTSAPAPGESQPDRWNDEIEAVADEAPPTSLPPEMLSPSRFEEEPPHERDIESAIGGWRRAGSLAPVIVRPDGRQKGRYEIITGAERWHAAKRLKMKLVPVAVTRVSDDELLRATLIERLRRRSLSPIEEARTYQRIRRQTGQSIVNLATDIGCAPSLITDALQLLELPDPVQKMLEDGKLTVLHARALLQADDAEALAREVVARQLDIYQTEQLARNPAPQQVETGLPAETELREPITAATSGGETDAGDIAPLVADEDSTAPNAPDTGDIRMIEGNLANLLGVEVSIVGDDDTGVMSLRYGDKQALRDLVSRLNRAPYGS